MNFKAVHKIIHNDRDVKPKINIKKSEIAHKCGYLIIYNLLADSESYKRFGVLRIALCAV